MGSAVLLAIIFAMASITGCIWKEEEKKDYISMKVVDNEHTIVPGNECTYIIIVRNKMERDDDFTVSVEEAPTGWGINMSKTEFNISGEGGAISFFITIKSPEDAKDGTYEIRLKCEGINSEKKKTIDVKVKVRRRTPADPMILDGDRVYVNMYGYTEDYKIFDTTIVDVGEDLNIPKHESFNPPDEYIPLDIGAGEHGFGYIKGFRARIVGMYVGQSMSFTIPPEEGWADYKEVSINLTENVPIYEEISINKFENKFKEKPEVNKVVFNAKMNWTCTVMSVNNTTVVVRNSPVVGQILSPYGWITKVVDINTSYNEGRGIIVLRHYPSQKENLTYEGYKIIDMKITDKTVTIKYNASDHPLKDATLHFQVTIVEKL